MAGVRRVVKFIPFESLLVVIIILTTIFPHHLGVMLEQVKEIGEECHSFHLIDHLPIDLDVGLAILVNLVKIFYFWINLNCFV